MVDAITYRTTDATRWGTGQGANLTPTQVDINFWVLAQFMASILAQLPIAEIDYLNVVGDQMYVHLTNHEVLGPYTLPVSVWNPRGDWTARTLYNVLDLVQNGNDLYLVIFDHTSGATFDPNANDGAGHNYYQLIFAASTSLSGLSDVALGSPTDAGDVLVYDGTHWTNERRPKSANISVADYTFALTDAWGYLRATNAGGCIFTVPLDATVDFPIDTQIWIRAAGGASVEVVPESGVVLNDPIALSPGLSAGGTALIKKVGADEWDLVLYAV